MPCEELLTLSRYICVKLFKIILCGWEINKLPVDLFDSWWCHHSTQTHQCLISNLCFLAIFKTGWKVGIIEFLHDGMAWTKTLMVLFFDGHTLLDLFSSFLSLLVWSFSGRVNSLFGYKSIVHIELVTSLITLHKPLVLTVLVIQNFLCFS